MISEDVIQEKAELTKINGFEFISENIKTCIFTLGSKFTYKGKPNDDLSIFISIKKRRYYFVISLNEMIHRRFRLVLIGLAKLIALLMVLLLLGSSFIGLVIYILK